MADLDALWHDDRLIEAAASGDFLDTDDPAAGALMALARVADDPLPPLDVDQLIAQAERHASTRYAVRSLAAAVAVVATMSASGVSAVVTGDPFRPAKAVWQQIQDHTRSPFDVDNWYGQSARAEGGAEVPATDDAARDVRQSRLAGRGVRADLSPAAWHGSVGAFETPAPGASGASEPAPAYDTYEGRSAPETGQTGEADATADEGADQPTRERAADDETERESATAEHRPSQERTGDEATADPGAGDATEEPADEPGDEPGDEPTDEPTDDPEADEDIAPAPDDGDVATEEPDWDDEDGSRSLLPPPLPEMPGERLGAPTADRTADPAEDPADDSTDDSTDGLADDSPTPTLDTLTP